MIWQGRTCRVQIQVKLFYTVSDIFICIHFLFERKTRVLYIVSDLFVLRNIASVAKELYNLAKAYETAVKYIHSRWCDVLIKTKINATKTSQTLICKIYNKK